MCTAWTAHLPYLLQWPRNVHSWTLEERWEECYRRMVALNISHDKIIRVWPLLVEYPVDDLEFDLDNFPTGMERIIDGWLAGSLWSLAWLRVLQAHTCLVDPTFFA